MKFSEYAVGKVKSKRQLGTLYNAVVDAIKEGSFSASTAGQVEFNDILAAAKIDGAYGGEEKRGRQEIDYEASDWSQFDNALDTTEEASKQLADAARGIKELKQKAAQDFITTYESVSKKLKLPPL